MRKGDSTEILWLLLLLCVYKAVTSNHPEREEMLFLPSFEQWQQPLQTWFVIKRERRGSPVCWAVMCPVRGAFSVCVCVLVAQSCLTLCDPVDCSHQAPLSMGFSKQEYWSGLPFFPPWDLPSPGIEPESPALQADSWLRNVQMTVQSTYLLGWTWQKEARLLEISFLKEQKVDLLELKPMNRQHVIIKLKTILRCYLQ